MPAEPRPVAVVHVLGWGAAQVDVVRMLAAELDPACYRLSAWFVNDPGPTPDALAGSGVDIRIVPFGAASDIRGAIAFARALRRARPAIVQLHVGGRARIAVTKLASSARVIAHLHGDRDEDGSLAPLRPLTRMADAVIAPSYATAAHVGAASVIPNAVDLPPEPLLRPPGHPPRIGAVTRLTTVKGVDRLLDVVSELRQWHPGLRAEITGDGPELTALTAQAERLGISDAVTFLGWRDDIRALHARWDAFAITSRGEGLPIAVLEAMASGLPVAGYGIGGVPELVDDGRTGLLATDGDRAALVAHLDRLLRDHELRSRLGEAGRRRVRDKFSPPAFARRVEEVYARQLARSSPAR